MSLPAYGQHMVLQDMWVSMGTAGKSSIQTTLNCCGFDASNQSIARGNPPCYSSDNTGPVHIHASSIRLKALNLFVFA